MAWTSASLPSVLYLCLAFCSCQGIAHTADGQLGAQPYIVWLRHRDAAPQRPGTGRAAQSCAANDATSNASAATACVGRSRSLRAVLSGLLGTLPQQGQVNEGPEADITVDSAARVTLSSDGHLLPPLTAEISRVYGQLEEGWDDEPAGLLVGFAGSLCPAALALIMGTPTPDDVEVHVQPDVIVRAAVVRGSVRVAPSPPGILPIHGAQSRRLGPGLTSPVASWGLDRIDQPSLPMSSSYGWTLDGAGVDVYVLDSGARTTHREVAARIRAGRNFVAGQPATSTEDCSGHGTHIAGTIVGLSVGVAKGATLIPVRVYGCDASGPLSSVLAGLEWTLQRVQSSGRPSVINLSFATGRVDVLNSAVDKLVEAGAVVVAAAGNEAQDACTTSPSSASRAITVASVNTFDRFSVFSGWGECVAIAAPGEGIISAGPGADDEYLIMSGTSMAAPHAAGVVAQLLQGRPGSSPADILSLLRALAGVGRVGGAPPGTPNLLLYSPANGCGVLLGGTGCASEGPDTIPSAPPQSGKGGLDGMLSTPRPNAPLPALPVGTRSVLLITAVSSGAGEGGRAMLYVLGVCAATVLREWTRT